MEDSEQGLMRSKSDQKQLKEKEQLKVAAWAVCKESNIAKGEGQSMVHSVCATVPGKRLNKSDKLKKENDPRDVSKFFASPCVEGLERKPIVSCEDQDLKTTAKAEGGQRDKLVELATVKEEVTIGELERREQKMKGKVEYGEERREGKCFKLEDSKDCGEEKSQAMDVEKMQAKEKVKQAKKEVKQAKEKVKAIIESMPARANEESQSQVKAEYEEGRKAKRDMERKLRMLKRRKLREAQFEGGSRREHIVEAGSTSEARVFGTLGKMEQKQELKASHQKRTQRRVLVQLSSRAYGQFKKWKGNWSASRAFVENESGAWVKMRKKLRFMISGDELDVERAINMSVTQSLTAVASPHDYTIVINDKKKKKNRNKVASGHQAGVEGHLA